MTVFAILEEILLEFSVSQVHKQFVCNICSAYARMLQIDVIKNGELRLANSLHKYICWKSGNVLGLGMEDCLL